ncbi:MAG: hypothetical protein ACI9CE_003750 [Flavobacterium sp.]|jgi:hypothetical protein
MKVKISSFLVFCFGHLMFSQSIKAEDDVSFTCLDPYIVNTLVGNEWEAYQKFLGSGQINIQL